MARIILHNRSLKYLKKLDAAQKERIKSALRELEADPLSHRHVIRMAGDWSGYARMRCGHFRIIFWYDENNDVVYIDHIGPRGDIYK